jgi:hypothetical protein
MQLLEVDLTLLLQSHISPTLCQTPVAHTGKQRRDLSDIWREQIKKDSLSGTEEIYYGRKPQGKVEQALLGIAMLMEICRSIDMQYQVMHFAWMEELLELKETIPGLAVNYWIGICCNDTCCKGGHMDSNVSREILVPLQKPMLYCNNQLEISVAKNNQYHAQMKHIDIQYHFICESIIQDTIEVRYCPTEDMVADIFTKALPLKTLEILCTLLGVYMDWGEVLF